MLYRNDQSKKSSTAFDQPSCPSSKPCPRQQSRSHRKMIFVIASIGLPWERPRPEDGVGTGFRVKAPSRQDFGSVVQNDAQQ
jgi:hypothetical protein